MAKSVPATKTVKQSGDGTVRVRLVKSPNNCPGIHRLSVKGLGLRKINDVRVLKDSPSVRGLINKVSYLVRVED